MFDDSDGFDLNFHFLDLKDLKGIMSGSPKGGKKNDFNLSLLQACRGPHSHLHVKIFFIQLRHELTYKTYQLKYRV